MTRTYHIDTGMIQKAVDQHDLHGRAARVQALIDETWHWRNAYAPMINVRRRNDYEDRRNAALHRHTLIAHLYAHGNTTPAILRSPL